MTDEEWWEEFDDIGWSEDLYYEVVADYLDIRYHDITSRFQIEEGGTERGHR